MAFARGGSVSTELTAPPGGVCLDWQDGGTVDLLAEARKSAANLSSGKASISSQQLAHWATWCSISSHSASQSCPESKADNCATLGCGSRASLMNTSPGFESQKAR